MRRFPLPFQPKSPTCRPREQQKKMRKSRGTDRILPTAQTASESHSMRLHERVAKGGAATVNGDECRSWAGHQVMLARVPHHQTTAPGRPSRPAAPGPVRRAADPVVHPDAKTRCVKIFRIGLGAVIKLISRMSPPQLGHASGNSSPTRASSFAQAIRDVSWWQGISSKPPAGPQQPLPTVAETPAHSPVFASRCVPMFPMASAVTACRRGWFGANTP